MQTTNNFINTSQHQTDPVLQHIQTRTMNKLEAVTKLVLSLIFLLLFAGFIYGASQWTLALEKFTPRFFDLLLLGLATMRLGRLVAFSQIMEPVRGPFAETRPDDSGAGDTVVARGVGVRQAIGQMITCPICAGTWIAAGLTYGLYMAPAPTRVFLMMTSAIGVAELLHSLIEALSWNGSLARANVGKLQREKAIDN